ncbi:MAG: AtpZ/AtpI family protein [Bryobacterales bacterium]|nr:AtpZ/AtpI family protein [Bryobacterales bacterium]
MQADPSKPDQETDSEPSAQQGERKAWRQFAEYSGLAMAMPIAAVLGYFLGEWLDEKLGTQFLGIVGLVLGIASGFVQLVTKALRDAKSSES